MQHAYVNLFCMQHTLQHTRHAVPHAVRSGSLPRGQRVDPLLCDARWLYRLGASWLRPRREQCVRASACGLPLLL